LLSDTKVTDSSVNTYFAVGDANGNVTEYLDNTGAVKAHYAYSAFGEITVQSGVMSDAFTHNFSTKPFDKETDLSVYELRYYKAPWATWLSRDPAEEQDGNNIYIMCGNNVVNRVDKLGLFSIRPVAGSPRIKTNSDGSFGGMWVSVVILPDDNNSSLSGIVLHMKHTEIRVTKCDGTPIVDSVQTEQKRIPTNKRSVGRMLESGKFAPIYSNLAQLKGYGKCVKGKIIIKAVWHHFINTTGLPPFGSPTFTYNQPKLFFTV